MEDPLDPATPEFIARETLFAFLTAESRERFDFTETMIWMSLGRDFDGLSIHGLALIISRDRKTIRARLQQMQKEGLVERKGNTWRLTEFAMTERRKRFNAIWARLPHPIRVMINNEAVRRGGKPQR